MNNAGSLVGTANVTLVTDAQPANLSVAFASPHGYAYDAGSGRSMLVYTRNTGRVQGVVYHTVQPESVEATPPITTVITTPVPVTPTDAGPASTATTTAIYLPLVATGP